MKQITVISAALLLIAASVFYYLVFFKNNKSDSHSSLQTNTSFIRLQFVNLEIADSKKEQEQGLMNRKNLCQKCGMLFVFPQEQNLTFWMKNTYLPLDIIFVDKNGKVVKIHSNTKPLQIETVYPSEVPALYVIETNAFFAQNIELKIGDNLDINTLISEGKPFQYGENQ